MFAAANRDGGQFANPITVVPGPATRRINRAIASAPARAIIGTTPLVDKVIGAIKADVSAATARSCRSVISDVLGLAVRRAPAR